MPAFRVQITSCVTRFEDEVKHRKKFTAFVIEIQTHGRQTWNVERRYREFYALNKALKQRYAELKLFKFPQKKWFSSLATSTVEKRRRDFEHYVRELVRAALGPTGHLSASDDKKPQQGKTERGKNKDERRERRIFTAF